MSLINKASPTSFKLFFPILPETESIDEQKIFTVNIISTVLPSITHTPLEYPFQGGSVYYPGGGIEYGPWSTNYYIDEEWKSYLIFYDWMMSYYDGRSVFGRNINEMQEDALLLIEDNYGNEVVSFTFKKIWPIELGDITLSYQDGEHYLSGSIVFQYDYFKKN